jgi:hypothetical protein
MIIPINEDWRAETTTYSIELQRRKVVPVINEKTGEPNKNPGETWPTVTYHATFARALAACTLRRLKGLESLSSLSECEARIMAEIATIKIINGEGRNEDQ